MCAELSHLPRLYSYRIVSYRKKCHRQCWCACEKFCKRILNAIALVMFILFTVWACHEHNMHKIMDVQEKNDYIYYVCHGCKYLRTKLRSGNVLLNYIQFALSMDTNFKWKTHNNNGHTICIYKTAYSSYQIHAHTTIPISINAMTNNNAEMAPHIWVCKFIS